MKCYKMQQNEYTSRPFRWTYLINELAISSYRVLTLACSTDVDKSSITILPFQVFYAKHLQRNASISHMQANFLVYI